MDDRIDNQTKKFSKIANQFKTLESADMLKDFDFELEKMPIVQKMTAKRESVRATTAVARPQKTVLSPSYNFYKPVIEHKNMRVASKKTDTKAKPKPPKNRSNFGDTKTVSSIGKSTGTCHISKPSFDINITAINNRIYSDTINNDYLTNYDISQLKSEQLSMCTEKEVTGGSKVINQPNTSVYSVNRGSKFNESFKDPNLVRKNLELDMSNQLSLKNRYVPITPNKMRDFDNKKPIEVNIFANKGKRDC